jgi:alpha,alpha-trehalase
VPGPNLIKVIKMHKLLFLLVLVVSNSFGQVLTPVSTPKSKFPGLFEAVQLARVYPDGKTFPDLVPLQESAAIMKAYAAEKDQKNFDLKDFTNRYFKMPANQAAVYQSANNASIREHIDTLWSVLYRQPEKFQQQTSLLPLPGPYLVPGGRFREVYYWDSYFTMLGLQESHHTELIQSMVDNFAYLIRQYGFIPNGNRNYYLTRSQPPFFSLMVGLLAEEKGELVYLNYLDALKKEYAFWMAGSDTLQVGSAFRHVIRLPDGSLLNRYWDAGDQPREESYREDVRSAKLSKQTPADFYRNIRSAAESGWDFSSRWFEDGKNLHTIKTTDLAAVDLNCLLYNLERSIAQGYRLQGDVENQERFQHKAAARKQAIHTYFWDAPRGWFVDYNWKKQQQGTMKTLAGLYPLFLEVASPDQAKAAAAVTEKDFLKASGLVTTLTRTNQQWDAPNAWAPLQWVGIEGLRKYGFTALSDRIALRWIDINVSVYKETGKLMEKYNVVDKNVKAGGGEYESQDGFGWTNGVLLKLLNRYNVK